MTFINKRPTDGPTNPQDILLDPEYVLCVFTTSDVISTYEAIQADEDYALPGHPSNFEELPEAMRLSLVEAAERVFEDVSRQNDTLMDAIRDALSEQFCSHCGGNRDGEWVCAWCASNICSQCMKNRLTFGNPCPRN